MNTIDITAMTEAGFTLDDLLNATPADKEALFELFPGPVVTVTTTERAWTEEDEAACDRFEEAYDKHIEEMACGGY